MEKRGKRTIIILLCLLVILIALSVYLLIRIHSLEERGRILWISCDTALEIDLEEKTAFYNIGGMRIPVEVRKMEETEGSFREKAYEEYCQGHFFNRETRIPIKFTTSKRPQSISWKTCTFNENNKGTLLHIEKTTGEIPIAEEMMVDLGAVATLSSNGYENEILAVGIDFLCEDGLYEVIIASSSQIIIGRMW